MSSSREDRERRVRWLVDNPDQWSDFDEDSARSVVERMRTAGLYSKSTYWRDVRIAELVAEARRRLAK